MPPKKAIRPGGPTHIVVPSRGRGGRGRGHAPRIGAGRGGLPLPPIAPYVPPPIVPPVPPPIVPPVPLPYNFYQDLLRDHVEGKAPANLTNIRTGNPGAWPDVDLTIAQGQISNELSKKFINDHVIGINEVNQVPGIGPGYKPNMYGVQTHPPGDEVAVPNTTFLNLNNIVNPPHEIITHELGVHGTDHQSANLTRNGWRHMKTLYNSNEPDPIGKERSRDRTARLTRREKAFGPTLNRIQNVIDPSFAGNYPINNQLIDTIDNIDNFRIRRGLPVSGYKTWGDVLNDPDNPDNPDNPPNPPKLSPLLEALLNDITPTNSVNHLHPAVGGIPQQKNIDNPSFEANFPSEMYAFLLENATRRFNSGRQINPAEIATNIGGPNYLPDNSRAFLKGHWEDIQDTFPAKDALGVPKYPTINHYARERSDSLNLKSGGRIKKLKKYADGGYVNSDYDPYLNTYNYGPPLSPAEYMENQMPDSGYEDGGYDDPNMSYSNAYDNTGAQYSFKEGGSVNEEELPRLADLIRRHGRNGDTELAHINPIEAHILKSLGGSGTINPATGLREYSFWKKPFKAIKSVLGGGAGAIIGNMVLPGIGGIIGGALGQGAQHAARGKSALGGALKGAGMGAALPSAASALGWGASGLGATSLGSSLSNYGTTNAILPALGMGSSSGSSGLFGLGGSNPYVSGAAALSQGMGTGRGQGLGVSSGDYAENYYNYMLDRQKKQDNMGFTGKLQDYLTEPGNLLTLGTVAAQYAGRQKPKSPEKIAEEERRYRNASRKTIAEIEADEAMEAARTDLQKKRKNKHLEEDIKNMGSVRRRVVSPEEFARTGRWLEYTDEDGNPVKMKGGGSTHSPYAYLTEESYYPGSPIGYLSGDSGGQDDLIDAKLSDGEYVFDASTVSDLGDGNNAAGARKLDAFRKNIRRHKRGGKVGLPPRVKSLESYLRG